MDTRKLFRVIVAGGLGLATTAGGSSLVVGCGSTAAPPADMAPDFPSEGPAQLDMIDVANPDFPREGPPPPPDMVDPDFPAEGPPPPPDMVIDMAPDFPAEGPIPIDMVDGAADADGSADLPPDAPPADATGG
jgi:hypothetical protein